MFEEAIITERINTRNVLTDVDGIFPLLELATHNTEAESPTDDGASTPPDEPASPDETSGKNNTGTTGESGKTVTGTQVEGNTGSSTNGDGDGSGGPAPGGPPPRTFFETISWSGKLNPAEPSHHGLLFALNELYLLSKNPCGKKKAYEVFPVSTGMILRTVYEQSLRLRLTQVNLWGVYLKSIKKQSFPTLKGMEKFIESGTNKPTLLPSVAMRTAFDNVITNAHRDFLNANIHDPGAISVTPDALVGIARGGMYSLIQGLINLLP